MADEDLSGGTLTRDETTATNLGLEEQGHRIGLQRSAFNFALVAACLLMMVATVLAMCSMGLYSSKDRFDWHVALLVGAFLVPATVITVAALRAAFPKKKDESDGDSAHALDVLKELVKEVASVFKKD